MMYKAVFWDLDGTLIDSEKEVMFCLRKAIEESGVLLTEETPLRVGPTIDVMLRTSYPTITTDQLATIVASFRKIYDYSSFEHTHPFEGIEDILAANKEIRHFIVTNKPPFPTQRILEKLGWLSYFAALRTPYVENSTQRKTKGTLSKELLCEFDIAPSEAVFVGDMAQDIQAGKEANIATIGVLWGTGTEQELTDISSDHLVYTTSQLAALLK